MAMLSSRQAIKEQRNNKQDVLPGSHIVGHVEIHQARFEEEEYLKEGETDILSDATEIAVTARYSRSGKLT